MVVVPSGAQLRLFKSLSVRILGRLTEVISRMVERGYLDVNWRILPAVALQKVLMVSYRRIKRGSRPRPVEPRS